MADSNEDPNKGVNLLYLASTHIETCNPRELIQKKRQHDVMSASEQATAIRNTSRITTAGRMGDKEGFLQRRPAVKTKSDQAESGPPVDADMPFTNTETRSVGSKQRDAADCRPRPETPLQTGSDVESGPYHGYGQTTSTTCSNTARPTSATTSTSTTSIISAPDAEELENLSNTQKCNDSTIRLKPANRPLQMRRTPVERICYGVHCPEKIVICFDMSQEMEKISFRSRAGDKFAPLGLLKRALGIFLHTKHRMDAEHEFALMVLRDTTLWMCDFTSDPNKIITVLEDLQATFQTEAFDMASVFEEIAQRVRMPQVEDPATTPPPYIVRGLFLYGRSNCIPSFSNREAVKTLHNVSSVCVQAVKTLQSSPHFFLDAFYIHEPPSEDNGAEPRFHITQQMPYLPLLVYKALHNAAPDYISDLLQHRRIREGLWSSDEMELVKPVFRLKIMATVLLVPLDPHTGTHLPLQFKQHPQ